MPLDGGITPSLIIWIIVDLIKLSTENPYQLKIVFLTILSKIYTVNLMGPITKFFSTN